MIANVEMLNAAPKDAGEGESPWIFVGEGPKAHYPPPGERVLVGIRSEADFTDGHRKFLFVGYAKLGAPKTVFFLLYKRWRQPYAVSLDRIVCWKNVPNNDRWAQYRG